jgi:hypothetical protein
MADDTIVILPVKAPSGNPKSISGFGQASSGMDILAHAAWEARVAYRVERTQERNVAAAGNGCDGLAQGGRGKP